MDRASENELLLAAVFWDVTLVLRATPLIGFRKGPDSIVAWHLHRERRF
jgi:hypothetical protein